MLQLCMLPAIALVLTLAAPGLAGPPETARDDPEALDPEQANPTDARRRFETRTAPDADAMLATGVEQRLQRDTSVDAMRIGIDARDGVVTLTGTVARSEQRERAASLARDVPGVRQVENRITVEQPGTPVPGGSVIPEGVVPD